MGWSFVLCVWGNGAPHIKLARKRSILSWKIYTSSKLSYIRRNNITRCCRCWNIFSSIFFIILFPILLVVLGVVLLITLLASVLGGFLCSCYYSRTEGYALWASIICCPCLGIFSVGNAVNNFFGEIVKVACGSVKKYCKTIKALCCFSQSRRDSAD